MNGKDGFIYDPRLGISIPKLVREWEQYTRREQEQIITEWEQIRGMIPERIKAFEAIINDTQARMDVESDFARCCALNSEIADYASRINDLHLWFRANQDISASKNHA